MYEYIFHVLPYPKHPNGRNFQVVAINETEARKAMSQFSADKIKLVDTYAITSMLVRSWK